MKIENSLKKEYTVFFDTQESYISFENGDWEELDINIRTYGEVDPKHVIKWTSILGVKKKEGGVDV